MAEEEQGKSIPQRQWKPTIDSHPWEMGYHRAFIQSCRLCIHLLEKIFLHFFTVNIGGFFIVSVPVGKFTTVFYMFRRVKPREFSKLRGVKKFPFFFSLSASFDSCFFGDISASRAPARVHKFRVFKYSSINTPEQSETFIYFQVYDKTIKFLSNRLGVERKILPTLK